MAFTITSFRQILLNIRTDKALSGISIQPRRPGIVSCTETEFLTVVEKASSDGRGRISAEARQCPSQVPFGHCFQ